MAQPAATCRVMSTLSRPWFCHLWQADDVDGGMNEGYHAPRSPLPPGVDPGYSEQAVAAARAAGTDLMTSLQASGCAAASKVCQS